MDSHPAKPTAADFLTPEALTMLAAIARQGSFAKAARELGLVPSSLTYRVRQIEDALDVLLFDRSARQARPTAAGLELLREGERLLADIDAVARRVRRVATGWEPELTIAVDSLVSRVTVMELCEQFFALREPGADAAAGGPPTRLRLIDSTLNGTLEAMASGQADLALGAVYDSAGIAGVRSLPLGPVDFVFAVAPHHPLASAPEPLDDAALREHRLVAVADSARQFGRQSVGVLPGQDVFTVATMADKLDAQMRAIGVGRLPMSLARPYLASGRLVARRLRRPTRPEVACYLWREAPGNPPQRALRWWLQQLERPATRQALLDRSAAL